MNTKRFVTLLNKAPYLLFTEVDYDKIPENILFVISDKFNLSNKDTIETMMIMPGQDLRGIIKATTKLPDPLACNIIEALANSLPNNDLYLQHFPVHFFTKSDWQNYIEWQNVDTKPTSQYDFTITVNKFTHDLHIVCSNDLLQNSTPDYDGFINLRSLDPNVPFPISLLKECAINIHDIIVQASIGRTLTAMTESTYLSVMQTGHDSFNYINMKKVEKDLRAVLTTANITIEE